MTTAIAPWSLTLWNIITSTWVPSTFQIVWPTAIWWINVTSSGPWNWFLHFLDLTVLNSWILLSSFGAQYTHLDFRLLVRNLIEEAGKSQECPTPSLVGRPSAAAANIVRLKSRHNQHWPAKSTQLRCRLCLSRGQRKTRVYKCTKDLCLVSRNITQKCICRPLRIVNSVCCDKIVIQGATDLLQQPELCE